MGGQQGSRIGPYRLLAPVGRGAAGTVWDAIDSRTEQRVAVTVLRPGLLDHPDKERQFGSVLRRAARIENPHLVPILDYRVEPQPYFVTPVVEGTDLASILRRGPIEPARAVEIVEQVADALHAVHQQGLVHGDIKPGNILLRPGALPGTVHVWLTDWSRAQAVGNLRGRPVGGTAAYVAPEIVANASALDVRADVYSLAAVLYECLAGHRPFEGQDRAVLLAQLAHDTALPLPDRVPAGLRAVVAKGLARRPEDRPRSAKEFAAAVAGSSPVTPHTGAAVPTRPNVRTVPAAPTFSAAQTRVSSEVRDPGLGLWLAIASFGLAALVATLLAQVDPSAPNPLLWAMPVLAALVGAAAGIKGYLRTRTDVGVPRPPQAQPKRDDIIEVTVYTSNDDGEPLRDAVVALLQVAGFELADQDDPIRGSFRQRLRFRRRESAASPELGELIQDTVRAASQEDINPSRSHEEATAIAALVQALSTTDEAVVTTSSILLIKSDGRMMCRVLNDREIRAVRAHPELIGQPQRLLWALAEIAGSDGADEGQPVIETQVFTCCPTCGYRPDEARERWQQHQDLSITWLSAEPEAPSALVERRHCRRCRPAEPSRAVVCEVCGAGPVIYGALADQMANGTPPESVLTWLRARGWYDRPGGVGMICSGHPATTMR